MPVRSSGPCRGSGGPPREFPRLRPAPGGADLSRFFELSLELFCIAGLDGYFRHLNENFPRVLGYSEAELVSRPFLEFIHPEDHEATRGAVNALREGKTVVRFVNRYRHARGHYIGLEWSSRAVPEEGVIYAVARAVS